MVEVGICCEDTYGEIVVFRSSSCVVRCDREIIYTGDRDGNSGGITSYWSESISRLVGE
jgi:hypothetical protein